LRKGLFRMPIGVVHTAGSPCQCAQSISEGLRSLGHEVRIVDAERIEFEASRLAGECDLIIDHTDTYRGRGMYRPLVRMILETHGGRIVGSEAKACLLADDKIASKAKLRAAGVPTPPGIVIEGENWKIPSWLKPPLVLKPAFEHMSRGVRLVRSEAEARTLAATLYQSLHQPLLLEAFIPGRELAVSLLEGPAGLEILPILEWKMKDGAREILSEADKLRDWVGERKDAQPAGLSSDGQRELEGMARLGFQVLGLRDYGRFDIRLSEDGTFYFLEANPTPSLEPLEALALAARWAGLDYPSLVERMLDAAARRYGRREREGRVRVDLKRGAIELAVPSRFPLPAPSSLDLAKILDIQPGETVLDLGCGTGLLAIAAARLGARRVVATDRDPQALELTLENARRNGQESVVETRVGSWYGALRGERERFDVILATPPQTPGPAFFGPKYGGFDGTEHLQKIIEGAGDFLDRQNGRLWLLAISLAHPSWLWRKLEERFEEVVLVKESERPFTAREYEEMAQGLFRHFLSLRSWGWADFQEVEEGRYVFRNLFIRARRVRPR